MTNFRTCSICFITTFLTTFCGSKNISAINQVTGDTSSTVAITSPQEAQALQVKMKDIEGTWLLAGYVINGKQIIFGDLKGAYTPPKRFIEFKDGKFCMFENAEEYQRKIPFKLEKNKILLREEKDLLTEITQIEQSKFLAKTIISARSPSEPEKVTTAIYTRAQPQDLKGILKTTIK